MSTIIENPRFSCALAGLNTVLAIPRGIPIVHAGPGCVDKTSGDGYASKNHIACTNTGEKEVVFGGEQNLEELIEGTLRVIDGDLFVALSGCTAGIIGDDVESVASRYEDPTGNPVVGVDTAGFRGNSYIGHELVFQAIIDQYIGNVEPQIKDKTVNVFSVVPAQSPYWKGDLEKIKELLEKIGLKVNIIFGSQAGGVSEIRDIPNAQFNLLISPWVGLSIVKKLEKKYGTPYFHYPYLPVGGEATSKFLRAVAEFAGISQEQVEAVIQKEEERFYRYFEDFSEFIVMQKNVLPYELYIAADSIYAPGIADYLTNELGFVPQHIYITDDPKKEYETLVLDAFKKAIPEYPDDIISFQADGGALTRDLEKRIGSSKKAAIFGSFWERELAQKTNNFHINICYPVVTQITMNRSYIGYDGALRLLEDLYSQAYQRGALSARTHVE